MVVELFRGTVDEIPLLTFAPGEDNLFSPTGHRLVVFYGGDPSPKPSLMVGEQFAKPLALLGFVVHVFEHRDKIDQARHHEFGLCDRIQDCFKVVNYLLDRSRGPYPCLPLSVVAISMGGHLAVEVASNPGFAGQIHSLVLIAPAAYHDDACQPGVKFGPQTREILRQPDSWQKSGIFQKAEEIKADSLVIGFSEDEVVKEIPAIYFNHLSINIGSLNGNPKRQMDVHHGFGHGGSFTNPAKKRTIIRSICNFLNLIRA